MKSLRGITVAIFLLVLALPAAAADDAKGTLVGKVVDERGKAIAGARVTATGAAAAETTTDAEGGFRLELDPGEYRLSFEAEGHATAALRDPVKIEAGKRTELDDRVRLPKSDARSVVRGSVFDEAGRSIPGAKVVLERVPGEDGRPVASLKLESRSDSTGMFAFRVPEGEARYRLTASVDRRDPASVTVDVFGGEIVNAPPLKLARRE